MPLYGYGVLLVIGGTLQIAFTSEIQRSMAKAWGPLFGTGWWLSRSYRFVLKAGGVLEVSLGLLLALSRLR